MRTLLLGLAFVSIAAADELPGRTYNRGDSLFEIGDFKGAIENYTRAARAFAELRSSTANSSDDRDAFSAYMEMCVANRAAAEARLGEFDKAKEDEEQALDLAKRLCAKKYNGELECKHVRSFTQNLKKISGHRSGRDGNSIKLERY
jgi:tetratricopeptide (TPR) repeat protein